MFGLVGSANEILTKYNARMDKGDLSILSALLASSAGEDNLTPMLNLVSNCAMYFAAVTSIVGVTSALRGSQAASRLQNVAQEMNESLKTMSENAEVSTNLKHQEIFPQLVYEFALDQISLAGSRHELDLANNDNLRERMRMLDGRPSSLVRASRKKVANYYFVFQPATDWHPRFNNMMREQHLPGFVGCTNSLEALGPYLIEFRKLVGPEPILHILLPSAHMYVVEEELIIPADLQPLRFTGQVHSKGSPYVYAAIEGLDKTDIWNVGLLPKPNVLGTWTKVGAAAGGIGAGIAGAIAGVAVGGALAIVGVGVAFPAMGMVATDLVLTGGVAVGLLGGGAAAGTAAGMHITETAKWKGTARDKDNKKKRR